MNEQWLPIPGYEGLYEVSDMGHARSLSRKVPSIHGHRLHQGKMLKLLTVGRRYPTVALCKDGIAKTESIHKLVLIAFRGLPPAGMEGCHWDDDPLNNRLGNLRWGTRKENFADRKRLGTLIKAEAHYASKLTEEDVRRMRDMHRFGGVGKEIAALFGLHVQHFYAIANGRKWKHVA